MRSFDSSKTSSGHPRLDSLQAVRAVAALLVVMYHLQWTFGSKANYTPFFGLFGQAKHGVDLFFVLSGFIITHLHSRDWERPDRLANYLFNRLTRIYPGVIVLTAFALAVYLAGFGGIEKADKLSPWSVIASALLLPQIGAPLVNVTWTLTYEIFFYVAFISVIVTRKIGWCVLAVWWLAILVSASFGIHTGTFIGDYYLRPICLEFGIGVLCAIGWRRLQHPGFPAHPILATGIIIILAMMFADTTTVPNELSDALVYGFASALILLCLMHLEDAGRLHVPPVLLRLGDASYAIYLVHFSVVSILASRLIASKRLPINDVTVLSVAFIGVAAGLLFDRVVDRPLQRLFRRRKPFVLSLFSRRSLLPVEQSPR